jgi:hypothetical protein
MRSKKSASKVSVALDAAKTQASDLQEKIAPAVGDAKERITPVVVDARDRITPVVADARDRLTPVVDDAKEKLADLAETVATKLDEKIPDKATPAVVKEHSSKSGGKLKKLLVLLGVGALAAVVARKLTSRSEPQWQSTAPGRPAPSTTASTPPEAAASVTGMVAGEEAAPDPSANDAAGGGTPDEAAADAAAEPHAPTTPDNPAEEIDVDKR